MKCLIIAAGRGSRLSTKGDSKPLIPLLGLSLIERVILTAKEAGLTAFYVVTGYNGEKVKLFLEIVSRVRKIEITSIPNVEWEKDNGLSVLKAKEILNEKFILLMADHIFDKSILEDLKDEKIDNDEIMLAIDCNIENNLLINVDDVTKVMVEDNRIVDIGKNIDKSNAYDTGIFLCTPAIFSAIEESVSNGDSSLSGGIRVIAEKRKAKTLDIKNAYWIDVDDKKTFKKAKNLLYGKLIKPADGLISRCINRKLSIGIFTPLFLKFHKGITPNQVSLLSFLVGLASASFFSIGNAITGALLVQISSILDGCDGEIARLKHMQSKFGDFFDAVLDRYADGFIFLGIFHYSLTEIGDNEILGVHWNSFIISSISVLAILGHLMVSYTSAKSVVNFGYRYKRKWIPAGRGRDLRLFVLFLGGVMTYFHPIFVLSALFFVSIQTNAIVLWRTVLSWNWSLDMDSPIKGKIKAVIFDFDGTVANTMPFLTELAVKLMVEKYNISKDEAKRKYFETTGMDFARQIELIYPNHPNNQEVANAFESMKLKGIFAHPIFPEVITVLRYFNKKRIKTFICSSTKQEIIAEYTKLNKIDDLLDGLFGYKPGLGKGRQIDFVLKRHKFKAEEVLFVGDSLKDFDLAKDKMLRFIGVTRMLGKTEFQKSGILSVSCLTDVVKLFCKWERYENFFEDVI